MRAINATCLLAWAYKCNNRGRGLFSCLFCCVFPFPIWMRIITNYSCKSFLPFWLYFLLFRGFFFLYGFWVFSYSAGAPLHVSLFQLGHLDHLTQVCNSSGSFSPDQDQFHLAPGMRKLISPTRPHGKENSNPKMRRIVQSSFQDLLAYVIIYV